MMGKVINITNVAKLIKTWNFDFLQIIAWSLLYDVKWLKVTVFVLWLNYKNKPTCKWGNNHQRSFIFLKGGQSFPGHLNIAEEIDLCTQTNIHDWGHSFHFMFLIEHQNAPLPSSATWHVLRLHPTWRHGSSRCDWEPGNPNLPASSRQNLPLDQGQTHWTCLLLYKKPPGLPNSDTFLLPVSHNQ